MNLIGTRHEPRWQLVEWSDEPVDPTDLKSPKRGWVIIPEMCDLRMSAREAARTAQRYAEEHNGTITSSVRYLLPDLVHVDDHD